MTTATTAAPTIAEYSPQQRAFAVVRILFGCVWLINAALQLSPAYRAHFLDTFNADWVSGQSAWVMAYGHWMASVVASIGPNLVAWITIVLDAILAVSLITGLLLPFLAYVGVFYNLWLWSTVGGFGGPYTQGATDPGTAIIYALVFVFVIASRSWDCWSLSGTRPGRLSPAAMHTARILFGLLWAFDAFWKWQPFFLHNAVSYLQQALPGEPAWIAAYITFFIHIINAVGPFLFGVFAALVESVIALFLLVGGKQLRWIIPVGIAYSFGVWTTAEGWGAPYAPGSTANKGDVLGTTNIYIFAFLFLAAWVYFRPHKPKR